MSATDFQQALPRLPNGEPDIDVWLDLASGFSAENRATAVALLDRIGDDEARTPGLALVELLLKLRMDFATVMAGMALFAVRDGQLDPSQLPGDVAGIVAALLPLCNTGSLSVGDSAVLSSQSKSQTDNVRHMLIALIDDPRVAVVKLAERIVTLRRAQEAPPEQRAPMASEAMQFFAPLANRLGIWQLQGLLEDLAFRYLHPQDYRTIADELDGRREARERQVEALRQDLEFRLSAAGIDAEVHGRAKHIYSIWRKMNQKSIDVSEVRDVQALRVLVASVEACYGVLGVVHTSWPPIQSEFDDYIANPKDNGYRSIHTAVIGPAGKTLEVQIRTREMHAECELGLCAHWAYKDAEQTAAGKARPSALQSEKIDWLRSVLEWHDEIGSVANGGYMAQERLFVTTPQGHVLDLPPRATVVDFAYRVHTDVGHRCRGARVNGKRVPLNRQVATGECVEIETGDEQAPKREWLNPALGYVRTSRARKKIQAWFKSQLAASNIQAGRALLEDTATRLGLAANFADAQVDAFAKRVGYESAEALFLAVGVGDQIVLDLVRMLPSEAGDDRTALAPDSRAGTHDLQRDLQRIVVRGRDRAGLLRDVVSVLADLSISVAAANARAEVPGTSATITLRLHLADMAALAGVIDAIRRVPDVEDVRRGRPA